MSSRRIIFTAALNLTVIVCSAVFYLQVHSIGSALIVFAVSATLVNIAAELPRRRMTKREGRPSDRSS
jgi:hypothetical protein